MASQTSQGVWKGSLGPMGIFQGFNQGCSGIRAHDGIVSLMKLPHLHPKASTVMNGKPKKHSHKVLIIYCLTAFETTKTWYKIWKSKVKPPPGDCMTGHLAY